MLSSMRDYRQQSVCKRAHGLALATYRSTQRFPKPELAALADQTRCAALKLVCSIAEGLTADTKRERRRQYRVASGSAFALDSLLLISRDLRYLEPGDWVVLDSDCRQLLEMLRELIASEGPL